MTNKVPQDCMPSILEHLSRIAHALERSAPQAPIDATPDSENAFLWQSSGGQSSGGKYHLVAVETVNHIPLHLLKGIDQQLQTLLENTERFAKGLPANNALLWGARGCGKSSLVKAIHGHLCTQKGLSPLALIEIPREDLGGLSTLLNQLRSWKRQCLIYCDDLSFEIEDIGYKALKALLDGGIQGRPDHVLFYATSNRRHLMARNMIENERQTAIHPSEAVEEKVSLSDRFGLWLGFHSLSQDVFFEMIDSYITYFRIPTHESEWKQKAVEWSMTRGGRSGRIAWQFVTNLAGEKGVFMKSQSRQA